MSAPLPSLSGPVPTLEGQRARGVGLCHLGRERKGLNPQQVDADGHIAHHATCKGQARALPPTTTASQTHAFPPEVRDV